MTTPPCPRCGAPLMLDGSTTCACSTCAYGHDAPRAMVPQPDAGGVAQEFATGEGVCGTPHGPGGWKDCVKCCAWVFSPSAPTPAANAKSPAVDKGMRDRVAIALYAAEFPGELGAKPGPTMYKMTKAAIAAILATHEIVRRPQ